MTVGPKRITNWIGGVDVGGSTTLPANTALLHASLNAAALAFRPFTVIRTRGLLSVRSDQSASSERGMLGWALAVVSDQAAAIGVTAVPTPITAQDSDLFFTYDLGAWGTDANPVGRQIFTYAFDSKAMRKVEDNQDVVLVIENADGSFGCSFQIMWRMLLKLH